AVFQFIEKSKLRLSSQRSDDVAYVSFRRVVEHQVDRLMYVRVAPGFLGVKLEHQACVGQDRPRHRSMPHKPVLHTKAPSDLKDIDVGSFNMRQVLQPAADQSV